MIFTDYAYVYEEAYAFFFWAKTALRGGEAAEGVSSFCMLSDKLLYKSFMYGSSVICCRFVNHMLHKREIEKEPHEETSSIRGA